MTKTTPTVYAISHEQTNPKFGEAFAKGCGVTVKYDAREWDGKPWAGFGSPDHWSVLTAARKARADWYYGDHAYFGRGEYFRITRNAYQYEGISVAPSYARWDAHRLRLEPWRTDGRHILVCPPDKPIAQLMGFDEHYWLDDVLCRLQYNTDRPIKVRTRDTESPLADDLRGAWAMVTWTSNAAVDALLAGVPVFCTGDCAASAMGRADPVNIEYPYYPDDREEWAATLAANQWTLDEIASGMAWERLSNEEV